MRLSQRDITPNKIKNFMAIPYNPESQDNDNYTIWNNYYDRDNLLAGNGLGEIYQEK